jgi:osmotically inducible protein OsmC
MAITRSATARYEGVGKEGKGTLSTQSGVLKDQRYGFHTRFEDAPGTNPEELIAAAHAGCFTMALSFALAKEGVAGGRLETTARVTLEQEGEGFTITRSDLQLTADVPGIDEQRLRRLAEDAKKNCPVSKLLRAEMALTVNVGAGAPA